MGMENNYKLILILIYISYKEGINPQNIVLPAKIPIMSQITKKILLLLYVLIGISTWFVFTFHALNHLDTSSLWERLVYSPLLVVFLFSIIAAIYKLIDISWKD